MAYCLQICEEAFRHKLLVLFTELKILFLLGHLTKRYDQSQSTQEERNVGGESLTSLAVS